jgi:hypothetical protein
MKGPEKERKHDTINKQMQGRKNAEGKKIKKETTQTYIRIPTTITFQWYSLVKKRLR